MFNPPLGSVRHTLLRLILWMMIPKPHCPASVQEMTFILTPLNFHHLWFCVRFCVMVKHTLYCLRADLYLSTSIICDYILYFHVRARARVCVCVISNFCVWWTDDWFMKPLFFWWAQCLWWSPAEETVSLRKQADQLLAAALCVDLLILPRECSSVRAITTDDDGLRNSVLHWWHSSTLSCVLHWWQYTTLFYTDDCVQHCSTLSCVLHW